MAISCLNRLRLLVSVDLCKWVNWHISKSASELRILANEWLVQQKQEFRKPKAFCEQIGHRSFVIVPHEIRVIPKGTAPCTNSAACVALAQFGDSLEKFVANS